MRALVDAQSATMISYSAQPLPSGSLKKTNRPRGNCWISLTSTPRSARRLDVVDHHLHALQRTRRVVRDARAQADRAGRSLGRELDEAEVVADVVVVVGVEADLLVERLGAVDVRHGNGHEFELPVQS